MFLVNEFTRALQGGGTFFRRRVTWRRFRKRGKTFSYIFEAGKIDGKRKVVEKGGFETKAAAYKAGVTAYNDFLHGNIGITSESITLKDFMTSWIENVVAANVKPTTIQLYKSLTANQIRPHLGEVKVQELTPAMLDKWIRGLQKKGLSHNTLRRAHALIHHALKYAVYPAQLIHSNPADYIQVPKNAPRNIIERHIISPEQFKLYLKNIPLRRGYYFTTLKTESSKRYILIDDFLLGEMRRWQVQQIEDENRLGDSYVYIYRESDGHILRQSKFLSVPNVEKVAMVCTRNNGILILKEQFIRRLKSEGLNAHSFPSHTRHSIN